MSKLRSVDTHFWSDNYVIDLDPTEKLLFLYLLTNENTNMLGVYELHIRKIAFETGIDKTMVEKIFERFSDANKASYIEGYVCLHNFTKHQRFNTNMKKSACKSFKALPESVQSQPFTETIINKLKPLPKGYQSLTQPIAEREVEVEGELEDEEELFEMEEDDFFDGDDNNSSNKKEDNNPTNNKSIQERNKQFNHHVKSLAKVVDKNQTKNIKTSNVKKWRKHFRLLNEQDGVPIETITKYLKWYIPKYGQQFIPEIRSGQSFRKKFSKLENAYKRQSQSSNKGSNSYHGESVESTLSEEEKITA